MMKEVICMKLISYTATNTTLPQVNEELILPPYNPTLPPYLRILFRFVIISSLLDIAVSGLNILTATTMLTGLYMNASLFVDLYVLLYRLFLLSVYS